MNQENKTNHFAIYKVKPISFLGEHKYFNKDEELAELEKTARDNKIGLWSQSNPVAPWDFRRKK